MKRVFPDHAYSDDRIAGCFWDEAVPQSSLNRPPLAGSVAADIAIIGAGFTGLSAALHAAQAGARVVVLDARHPGWGASGRNGGFCCLGGSMSDDGMLDRRYGRDARLHLRRAERAAVNLVAGLIRQHAIEADVHSDGETQLAHKPSAARWDDTIAHIEENHGVTPEVIAPGDLPAHGMGGAFHGAMTVPIGFGLHPRKYLSGLLDAAEAAGATVHGNSPVTTMERQGGAWRLATGQGEVQADQVIIATNGYSSEDMPEWMAARYMPAQSSVIVTRPLSGRELDAQGWTSAQMAYDTRHLLHYFRLMPDGRFLFGMRGGLRSSPRAEAVNKRQIRKDFSAMFPAWRDVEAPYYWSGMVCLSAGLTPFCGPVPGMAGVFAGFAFHGNGVAMGTHVGALLAELAADRADVPVIMQTPAPRFPLGRFRRALMLPAYGAFWLRDRFG